MEKIFNLYKDYYKSSYIILFIYVLISIFHKAVSLFMPLNIKNIIDTAVYEGDMNQFTIYVVIAVVLFILFVALLSIRYFIQNKIEVTATTKQKEKLLTNIMFLKYENFANKSIGYFIQLINTDIDKTKGLIIYDFTVFATNIVYIISMFVSMFLLNKAMAFMILVFVPLFVIVTRIMIPKLKAINEKLISVSENINNSIDETVNGALTIKLASAYLYVSKRINLLFNQYTKLKMKYVKYDIFYDFVLVTGLLNAGNVLIVCVGGFLAIKGMITIGIITTFSLYFSTIWNCTESFMNFFKEYRVKMISVERLVKFYNMTFEHNDQVLNTNIPAEDTTSLKEFFELDLKSIRFSYGENQIFNNFNLIIQKGDKLLITGENGSGKSTLGMIMVKLFEVEKGSVTYNGLDYSLINFDELRKRIYLLPAEPFIFEGSINDNLFGQKNNLDFIADKLTYDEIGRNGNNLSSGQRKILQLARALNADADVYIFDEPLNYVDEKAKIEIISFIREKFIKKTLVIISHEPQLWDFCSKAIKISMN